MPTQEILDRLARTTEATFSQDELKSRLDSGRPLRIKYGVDVTASFLHIGHAVNLWMMRCLQEYGHVVVFLIGDFTTRIGDPTGRDRTRVVPSREEIEKNADEFTAQVGQILLTDPKVFEIRRNSEWFDPMPVDEFVNLLSLVTHSRLIQRDMFQRRMEANTEIYMHELLYPVLQGYDSKMLCSDLTIVGSDQQFNELMGRHFQEKFGQPPQVVMTTKITPGTDGKQKQSKTLGNYIALADAPRNKFGKAMSIPDSLIVDYLKVYTEVSMEDVKTISVGLDEGTRHPMEAKKLLASALVERYHGKATAEAERLWFEQTFSKRETPEDLPTMEVFETDTLLDVLQRCDPKSSKGNLRRLLRQGGVRLNHETVSEEESTQRITVQDGDTLRMGKKLFFRVVRK